MKRQVHLYRRDQSMLIILLRLYAIAITFSLQRALPFSLQKVPPNLDNDLDMDPMMINDNNEDMILDDNTLEELRASDKSPLWQVEILDRAASNAGNMDASNLNESDASAQSCRNSIQVSIYINTLTAEYVLACSLQFAVGR